MVSDINSICKKIDLNYQKVFYKMIVKYVEKEDLLWKTIK